jgi:hypothetical protein
MTRVVESARALPADGPVSPAPKYSVEYFVERLGRALVDDVLAQVAAAPPPSAEKVAEVRRLFAVVQLNRSNAGAA